MATGKSPYVILEEYGQDIIDSLRKSLVDNNRYVSGNLAKSIGVNIKVFGHKITLQITMDEYWKFVDSGVNGTKTKRGSEYSFKKKNLDQSAMLKHIANRGQRYSPIWNDIKNYRKNSKGLKVKRGKPLEALKAQQTLAFLLGRSLAKKGFAATNFVEEGLVGIEEKLTNDLSEAVGREILIQFDLQ